MTAPSDTAPSDVEIIRESGLFDPAFYLPRVGTDVANPIEHYVNEGEARGIAPSEHFDPAFYRQTNPDVAEAGVCLLVHYIRHGRREGRYATATALSIDAGKIREKGFVDLPPIQSAVSGVADLPAIEQHLVTSRFDSEFYARTYEDARNSEMPPLVHYLEIGQKQQRPVNQRQLSDAAAEIQPLFDEGYYREQAKLTESSFIPAEHYLTVGRFRGYDPSPNFSVSYYLRAYPDVAQNGIDPFTHYVRYAKNDKRSGRPDFSKGRISGSHAYRHDYPTVLIVNHDASRTGAPLVGLEAARHFSEAHNVFIYCLRDGELIEEFSKSAVYVNVGAGNTTEAEFFLRHLRADYHLDGVILNSAETSAFADAALYAGVPSIALIHEFAEYTFPPGRTAKIVSAVDRAVVPAQLIFDSVQREIERHFGSHAPNIVIRPQGCLRDLPRRGKGSQDADLTVDDILTRLNATRTAKPPIVLGAGFFHMRKGVELFVQAAQEARRRIPDVKFIWVGAGYAPNSDATYSIWVAEAVRRLGLENTVFFLPPQSQLDSLFELCDVFFLSSRLDPFPSVVLDAFEAGKPVVCFDNATGAAELFKSGAAIGAVVEYANAEAAGKAIADILRSPSNEAARVNPALVDERFRFGDYVAFLDRQIELAKASRAKAEQARDRILASGAFDPEFHEGAAVLPFDLDKPSFDYVARATKGLSKFSPRPGFNDGLYRSRVDVKADEAPLDHALRTRQGSEAPTTHRCVALKTMDAPLAFPNRTALHLHLFYPELANDFVQRLNAAAHPIDIFATTTDPLKQAELEDSFSSYKLGRVSYIQVPNRGRDIGPVLTELERPLAQGNYDIVGHLHSKRSLAVDAAMGERWRTYLLDTLLGDTFSHLLSLFADDPKLGLIFAEDRHAAGWNANYDIAKGLAARAKPPLKLPAYPYFPLGTMFWARREALVPLWSLKLRPEDFPPEPAPYDGTVLHTLERLLPASAEAAGLSWCTVYDRRYAW